MALEKYRAKRDFTTSPEPAGEKAHRSPRGRIPRFFCVQKHLASHLHYDLRLEHEGVLLSWAVPKGPSLDPATKRLAMHVEDHPVDYGEFEGVIPSGYGAGIVMLWDRGTWTPEVDDVEAALKKGDLKFTLDGYKLKGSWVSSAPARRSRATDGRSWVLIKHRDEWAGGRYRGVCADERESGAVSRTSSRRTRRRSGFESPGKAGASAMLRRSSKAAAFGARAGRGGKGQGVRDELD
jgi:bifunctional non-homologous end joining protein LigD